ncbi:hypothetical protein RA957_01915 [Geobacillus kaustophilus]|nr:hypothetical protein [Geobacillus kaustophilus]WMJ20348.1 hypothetical protein RA957_01915 [Geobacillus kaustophilus]
MQEHFHFTTDRAKIQKQYADIFFFVSAQLSSIQTHLQRRNRHLVKQEDDVIIAFWGSCLAFLPNGHVIALSPEFVHKRAVSRTFSIQPSLSGAALGD